MKRIVVVTVAVLALAGCKKPQGPQTTDVTAPEKPAHELAPASTDVADVAEVPEAPVKEAPAETASTDETPKAQETDKGYVLYTVKKGEGLMKIARQFYGDASRYKEIAKFNNITDPDKIQAGQVLKIPK